MSGTTYSSVSRRPRLRVLANGAVLNGAKSAEVSSNGYLQADRFRVDIAVGPDQMATPAWWADTLPIKIEVQIGFLPDGAPEGNAAWQSMLIGNVDHVDMDWIAGCVTVEGRDLSSLLIEAKTQETFSNQTSSQIATVLAGRHGLTPMVTATTTPVGQYYQLEHDRTTLNNFSRQTTEWDLLTYLAEQEGFDVWVAGNNLYFQPAPPATAAPFPIVYDPASGSLSVSHLRMERSLTLAHDMQVTVKSWNSKHKAAFVKTAKSTGVKSSGGPVQNYTLTVANKTPDEALKIAQQKLAELTKHERILSVDMPGELTLSTRSMVGLSGTGTAFDQAYYVAEVERDISFDGGFRQRLRLKNSSPRTQTTVL